MKEEQYEIIASIVIAVFNDERHIGQCLQSVLNQSLPRAQYEVIVVDDGSTDRSGEIVRQFPGVTYVRQDNAGPSTARNTGIILAKGVFIAFADSDCICPPAWLETFIRYLRQHPEAGGIGSGQVSPPDDSAFGRALQGFLETAGLLGGYVKIEIVATETDHNASCNVMYRRKALLEIGGFRHKLFPGEDVDLDKRLVEQGYTIWFCPEIPVQHYRPSTRKAWHRMLWKYGRSSGDNVRIHGFFRIHHYLPWIVCFGALGALAALFVSPALLPIAAILGGLFVGILTRRHSTLPVWTVIVFGLETVVLFSFGYFWGLCRHEFSPQISLKRSLKALPLL